MKAASRPWGLLAVLALGAMATMMAATLVNVALPSVIGAFGLGQEEAQWLSTAFLTSSTAFMLLNAWAMAAIGMRAAFCLAMTVFVAGSLAGAAAQDLAGLILGRALQGAGAGMVQPMGVLAIFSRFPPSRRGTALGLYSLCVIFSPAFGPTIGGWVAEQTDWRMTFVATAPVAGLALLLGAMSLPHRSGPRLKLDTAGIALATLALVMAVQGLASGRREGWDDAACLTRLWLAGVAGLALLLWEARHPAPVISPRLFMRPGFALAGLMIFAAGGAVYSSTYLAPQFVQLVQHYSPMGAGEILAPAGVAMALCFPLAGRLSDHLDARCLLAGGIGLFGASMLMLADAAAYTPFGVVALALAIGRAGIGLTMPAAHAAAMREAPDMLAHAAPAATFLSQTGGALGVAVVSVLLGERAAFHIDALQPLVNASNAQAGEALALLHVGMIEAGLAPTEAQAAAAGKMAQAMWASAQMLAFRDCFLALGVAFLALTPLVLRLPGRGDRRNFTDLMKGVLTLFR